MVLLKPGSAKPSATFRTPSTERNVPDTRHGAVFLALIGLFFIILFVAQVWTFCFLYGKLNSLEILNQPSKGYQKDEELLSIVKQEMVAYLHGKLPLSDKGHRGHNIEPSPNELEGKYISRKKSPGNAALETSDRLEKSYMDDKPPTGPPRKTFDVKEWLLKSTEDEPLQDEGNERGTVKKRSISETLYNDGEEELQGKMQRQVVDPATDQSWLQLTSYARIPGNNMYDTIQEFCSRTRASCPAGEKGAKGRMGDPGRIGPKGDRGVRGPSGFMGEMGEIGLPGVKGHPGPRGIKGYRGYDGKNGVDGRDGLPGEPGLDGIPGRHGMDGKDGKCSNGRHGMPGKDGQDGRDGFSGQKGLKGVKGLKGHRGITGPRGRAGRNGVKGQAGIPGITAFTINGTSSIKVDELLIAPTLADKSKKTFVVREKSHVRMSCLAAGHPKPYIEWTRRDPLAITTGYWKDGSLEGTILNITHISREHTGLYQCEAYNGVPPNTRRLFEIKVEFEPYIRVIQWKVGASPGQNVTLKCHVESFPQAVVYWENQEARILENSSNYEITHEEDKIHQWKSVMKLTINNVTAGDFGNYFCEAKNELSTTRGVVKLHEIDPTRYTPKTGKVEGLTFGPEPPNYAELFNASCDTSKCCKQTLDHLGTTNLRYCIRVEKVGQKTKKIKECILSAVGKPVYQAKVSSEFGSWTRDLDPDKHDERYWRTVSETPGTLFEFKNKNAFRNNGTAKRVNLPYKFQGDSHVIYNGIFFYHSLESQKIIGYDLLTEKTLTNQIYIPHLQMSKTLYSSGNNYVDLSTDENGLWAIYGIEGNENTMVMKINETNLKEEFSLNISLSHYKFGEMFITCGILYGIESASEKETRISLALDLYKEHILDIDLPFTNPVSSTTMLNYNPDTKMLYSWAHGTQLTYLIKLEDVRKHSD